MAVNERMVGKRKVKIVTPDESNKVVLSPEDKEMDKRVSTAVSSAIKRPLCVRLLLQNMTSGRKRHV